MALDQAIARKLTEIVGVQNAGTEVEARICHSYDASKQSAMPDIVLKPATTEEVSEIVKCANENSIPVVTWAGGSGLSGGAIPLKGGIALDTCRMNRIIEIDTKNMTATVQPGIVVTEFQNEVAKLCLLYPPDPASADFCTIGGNISECAGGLRCIKYGVTRDYVLGLEVVLPDGSITRFGGKMLKSVSGYDVMRLFVGSEGTLGVFTEATLKLIPLPPCVEAFSAFLNDTNLAMELVHEVLSIGELPRAIEFMDRNTMKAVRNHSKFDFPEETGAFLLVEYDGWHSEAVRASAEKAFKVVSAKALQSKFAANQKERDALWAVRKASSPALYSLSSKKLSEDVSVPRTQIGPMLTAINTIEKAYGLTIACFGHAGDGNIHINVIVPEDMDKHDPKIEKMIAEIFERAMELKGTLSGEHGIGNLKAKYMHLEFSEREIELMKSLKKTIDPKGIMNPGKIFV
jgi:glycolate oxidase